MACANFSANSSETCGCFHSFFSGLAGCVRIFAQSSRLAMGFVPLPWRAVGVFIVFPGLQAGGLNAKLTWQCKASSPSRDLLWCGLVLKHSQAPCEKELDCLEVFCWLKMRAQGKGESICCKPAGNVTFPPPETFENFCFHFA